MPLPSVTSTNKQYWSSWIIVFIKAYLLFTLPSAYAATETMSITDSCEQIDSSTKTIKDEKQQLENNCKQLNKSNHDSATVSATQGEIAALSAIEKQLEEERLKVLYIDINSVMETVSDSMDATAGWIDDYFSENEESRNKAKAWGHIVLGWEPKSGEWMNVPVKFKVKAKLPNLKDRVELILSDDEQEDLNRLPYESIKPENQKSTSNSLGVAVRVIHRSVDNIKSSSRIGWGNSQVYYRSSLTYRNKYLDEKVSLQLQPSIEYYFSDGWGARFLFDTGYKFNDTNDIHFNYSIRNLETYENPLWRAGVYHFKALNNKSALIIGASSSGVTKPIYSPNSHKFSVRYRRKAIRSWIFVEVEPYVEFVRTWGKEGDYLLSQENDFDRDVGISFRLEAHYGYLK